ncbi:GIY-YIG nuclease family protein [Streptomyces sp. NPDC127079]|uniref:GIY-YIG nuclease family protein n=1 Tax=Streptomyces sp. NPDC127079 TaxID=3347132 RepID=UPI0036610409
MQATEEVPAAERTAVYRLYDEAERLLYVGVASDPRVRFKQHERDKARWPRVTARAIEWFDSRDEALKVEARVITRELPLHNEAGVQWPHHRLGEAPAPAISTTTFQSDPPGWFDHVAERHQSLVVTRNKVPLVVIVPYFDRGETES